MTNKYNIGDKVKFPTNSGYVDAFHDNTDHIPEKYIVHGALRANVYTGIIVHIYNEYYIVKLEGRTTSDNTGFLRLGFREEQLTLVKAYVKKTEYYENKADNLFDIDAL